MDTILILTDFSDSAYHAAKYVCALSGKLKYKRVILLNVYQTVPAAVNVLLVPEEAEYLDQESLTHLKKWRQDVRALLNDADIVIESFSENADLVEAANALGKSEKIDLMVMGARGKSGLDEILVGNNTNRLLASCDFPLLIVPKEAAATVPENIVLATDLKHVKEKLSLKILNRLMAALQARLYVLNVETGEEKYSPATMKEITALHELLDHYKPQYHYTNHLDITEGIKVFALEKQASLIIAIHHAKTGLAGLFQKSISKKLAQHNTIPVLVIPVAS
jgi:nucleotide-binding universal stress UspA family protein